MSIEFLYAAEDIPDLVDYLYDNGFFFARSAGIYKGKPLSPSQAESSLESDLFFPGSKVYWIGNEKSGQLLQFVSCGKQSEPYYVGKRGRDAGFLSTRPHSDMDFDAILLLKSMRKYLKKHATFQRYNGDARMNCYFLPYYRLKEERYLQNPYPDYLCLGTGRVICYSHQKMEMIKKLETVSSCFPAIQNFIPIMRDYWVNTDLSDIRFTFLCDHNNFSFFDFQRLIRWLSDNKKSVVANQKLQMFGESPPMPLAKVQMEQPHIMVFLDNPWQCWINYEHEYSGKSIVLRPDSTDLNK